jgi:hypothetical protein
MLPSSTRFASVRENQLRSDSRQLARITSPTKNDYDTMVETLSFNALSTADQEDTIDEQVAALIDGGFWTVANLHSCFLALQAEGLLEVQRELPAT